MNIRNILISALVVASLAFASGAAVAHTCASYDDCDAGGCTEGENHDHTDYNYLERDESCSSTSAGPNAPPPPPRCIIADKEFPPEVCDLLNGFQAGISF